MIKKKKGFRLDHIQTEEMFYYMHEERHKEMIRQVRKDNFIPEYGHLIDIILKYHKRKKDCGSSTFMGCQGYNEHALWGKLDGGCSRDDPF